MTEATLETKSCRKLPLHAEHEVRGARMGAFGEWLVPLYYTSILDEHQTVRTGVGVFDISHMGEFYVSGKQAAEQINHWITNDVYKLTEGQALYSPICRENGGIVDDLVVFKMSADKFYVIVNAANIEKDFMWFRSHLWDGVLLEDVSQETGLLAIQGPKSPEVVRALFQVDLSHLSYYHFLTFDSPFGKIILSETGYTGEKGYEIFCPMDKVRPLWNHLFEVGKPFGLKPVGFGARDTLRLEAKFALYGHDLSDDTTPVEAGLSWTIGWNKKEFIGKRVLDQEKTNGSKRKLIGFEMQGRGIPRQDCRIFSGEKQIGKVTSGSFAPTLKKNIGLAYVEAPFSGVGTEFEVEIRGRLEKASVVKTPFYKRQK